VGGSRQVSEPAEPVVGAVSESYCEPKDRGILPEGRLVGRFGKGQGATGWQEILARLIS
jgi:hypothetical protein